MKKKGLIISTVVMVVVLIASLTTATYAWFTASNRTTISGFDVSVVAGNAVNIGVKANNTHEKDADNDMFLSGDVNWTGGTAGKLSGEAVGTWTSGNTGLGATLNHGILWGAQSKAVGAVNAAANATSLTSSSNYGYIGDTKGTEPSKYTGKANTNNTNPKTETFLNAANLDAGDTLKNVEPAVANKRSATAADGQETNGDYVYLFLGASPTETLTSNSLIIMLDGSKSSGTNIGMLAAVHVAYRFTKAGAEPTTAWTEAEFFTGKKFNEALTSATLNLSPSEKAAYNTAYGGSAPSNKAGVVRIGELSHDQGAIDQIELIIYIAGSDPECVDNAKNASGLIKMFFATESATASDKPTNATIDNTGKLTLTGAGADTLIQYRTKSGESWGTEVAFDGTWSTTTYTVNAVGDTLKDATIQVRQKAPGKAWSEWADVENKFKTA